MNDDPRLWAGYRTHTRARSTGTCVVLLDGYEQGITNSDDGFRWVLLCDEHDEILECELQEEARQFLAAPEAWCQRCSAAFMASSAPSA